jgi:hypothetical protein
MLSQIFSLEDNPNMVWKPSFRYKDLISKCPNIRDDIKKLVHPMEQEDKKLPYKNNIEVSSNGPLYVRQQNKISCIAEFENLEHNFSAHNPNLFFT